MSLANRVFMLFGVLMIVMLGSQWYMMRSVTTEVSSELGKVAFSVAKDTATYFVLNDVSWIANGLHSSASISNRQRVRLANGTVSEAVAVIEMKSPSVEVRINNQRTDDTIQLISGNRTTEIPLPREEMTAAVANLQSQMIISTLIILGVGLLLAGFLARKLMLPVNNLSNAAHKLAAGSLGTQVQTPNRYTSPEIKQSIQTFNEMSNKLQLMQQENKKLLENVHYKELGYISSGLAHSIRNPLNTLTLTIEQLADSEIKNELREKFLKSAYGQINRIDNWVKSFMTFSLGNDAETTNISIEKVLQSIILECKQMREDVQIKVNRSSELFIYGIEAELHAIFHSLVVNAVEASPESEVVEIDFRVKQEPDINEDIMVCCVRDHGNGIPQKIQETLFQPHKTTKANGSGMGLYMAQKLAENRYKGKISLLSSTASGSELELQLEMQRKI